MISRRNFLKIAGLSTLAVGAGFTAGRISDKKSVYYAIHGFIPADEHIISQLVAAFKNKIKSNSNPVVIADSKIGEVINRFDLNSRNSSFTSTGNITYRLHKLDKTVDSDIIAGDNISSVYSPDDMNVSLSEIRTNLRNRKAQFFFTAEYSERDFLSSLFSSDSREVVIENEKGLVDRISAGKNFSSILIDGPVGKTGLKIENGIARVISSCCRNGICRHSGASAPGSVIACAPNKVLIKIT